MAGQLQLAAVRYKRGSYIIVEGKPAMDQFFIIREGKVQVFREAEKDAGATVLGAGEVFGVVSAMSSHSCIETVVALSDVTLISVKKDQYGDLIQQNTPIAMKIIQQFSQRLRYLDVAFSRRSMSGGNVTEDMIPLFTAAEYYAQSKQYNHAFYAYQQYLKQYPEGEFIPIVQDRLKKIAARVTKGKPAVSGPNAMERIYPVNSIIFAEGERGDELYIIRKGSVKISKITDHQEVLLAVLKTGDIFGEMALLEDKPRTASAVVYEECTVMMVTRASFEGLITGQPQLIARLTSLLAERLWLIYKQMTNTLIDNPLGRVYDALLIQLEKDLVAVNTNQSHLCNFGIQELLDMAGISRDESDQILKRVLLSKRITLSGDKIYVADASDVARQADYYRRAQKSGTSHRNVPG